MDMLITVLAVNAVAKTWKEAEENKCREIVRA